MVIVRLVGGIGNQLFQIVGGLSLAKYRNQKCVFDLGNYSRTGDNYFRLPVISLLNQLDVKTTKITKVKLVYYRLCDLVFNRSIYKKRYYNEALFHEPYGLFMVKPYKQIINSYFGLAFGFEEVNNLISTMNKMYQNNKCIVNLLGTIKNLSPGDFIVGVHVRRTDYLKESQIYLNLLDETNYYKEAMSLQVQFNKNTVFIVFSDDKKIKADFTHLNSQFKIYFLSDIYNSEDITCTDLEELYIMSNLDGLVIANSTFSLWAAIILSHNKSNNSIYLPSRWYKNDVFQKKFNDFNFNNYHASFKKVAI